MAFSAGDQAALKAAQDVIKRGQDIGDQSVVDAGMQAQSKILDSNGTVYPTGDPAANAEPGTPLPKSWGGTGISSGGAVGTNKGDALERELKSLYGSGGAYAAALAAQQRAQQANVSKAVNTLEGQKQSTNQSYAELFRQLYKEKQQAQKNIGQKMAAQGVTGGASESTLLGLETGYAEALRQGEQGRLSTVNEIDRAIADARLDGDIANAQLAAESARAQTAEYAGVLRGLLNRYDNQQATKESNARQLALAIAQSGEMPTDELLAGAGLSRADVESIVGAVESDRGKEDEATTYKRALEKAENLAKYGDFSGYAALGYTAEEIAAMDAHGVNAAINEQLANELKVALLALETPGHTLSAEERAVLNRNGYNDGLIASIQKEVIQKHRKDTYIAPQSSSGNDKPSGSIFEQLDSDGRYTQESVVDWLVSEGYFKDPKDAQAMYAQYYVPWLDSVNEPKIETALQSLCDNGEGSTKMRSLVLSAAGQGVISAAAESRLLALIDELTM